MLRNDTEEKGIPSVANRGGNTDKNVFILGSAKIIKSLSSYAHEGNSFYELKKNNLPQKTHNAILGLKTHRVLVESENAQVIG